MFNIMLEGVVSSFFIVLNKLPRLFRLPNIIFHGVTLSFHKLLQFISVRFRWVWAIADSAADGRTE
jgi:hypothetical protein